MVDFFHFLHSKLCVFSLRRPMSCDEEQRPVAEFVRESIVFGSTCTKKFTFAISSADEFLVIDVLHSSEYSTRTAVSARLRKLVLRSS